MAKYMRKADREEHVIETALAHRQVGVKTFTVYKIAKWLGMSPSTHLRKLLMGLVEKGVLQVTSKLHRHNVKKSVFNLTDEAMLSMAML